MSRIRFTLGLLSAFTLLPNCGGDSPSGESQSGGGTGGLDGNGSGGTTASAQGGDAQGGDAQGGDAQGGDGQSDPGRGGSSSVIIAGLDQGGSAGDSGSPGGGGTGGDGMGGDATGGAGMGGTGMGGAGATPDACCVPAAPANWSGPVRVDSDDTQTPTCPETLPTVELEGGTGVDVEPGSCNCQCGDAPEVTCPNPIKQSWTSGDCGGSVSNTFDFTEGCTSLATSESITFDGEPVGTCTAVLQENLPPPEFATKTIGCGSASASDNCDAGDTCLPLDPDGTFTRTCIYRTGNHTCPAGAFQQRELIATDFADERSCQACTCTAQGMQCSVSYVSYTSTAACSVVGDLGETEFVTGTNTCGGLDYGDIRWLSIAADDAVSVKTPGTCQPNSPVVEGSVGTDAEITVCCL